ncbi:MAG: extracellular solute-binding protein [Oscillospiraceae bacterium]|nr:extracellular solute-binding protein [Oscillospiraceae bacterium]
MEMKRKILINIMILACVFALASCRNISAQDFGPEDIVNILEVVMSKNDFVPETDAEPAGAAESAQPETEESIEETDETKETKETKETPEETAKPEPTIGTTAPPPTTERETEPVTVLPPETTTQQNPYYETGEATIINIRDIFPEAPKKFWEIAYPESVPMLESFKKNIKNLAGFSARDFKGFSFYIATTESKLFTPFYGGGMLSDARRYRTEIVETECNAQMITLDKPKASILEDIRLSVQADEVYSDILCVPFDIQSALIQSGFAMNLKKIPFLNINAEYYSASATEAFTINGNIFGLVSDLVFDPSNIYAVFYNRTLLNKYNLKSPLEIYKNGAWNWDSMFSVSKELAAAAADFDNADAPYSVGLDKENGDVINGLFISSGNKYFMKRDYTYPVMNFSNDKTVKLIEALADIFSPPAESGIRNFLENGSEVQEKAFAKGNILFSVSKLEMLPDITDSKFDWGLLPVPSTETDRASRFSFTGSDALCISILQSARNTEACGIVIGALSAASHGGLKDIYVKEQMTFHLRDVDSVGILRDIVGSIAFNQYNAFVSVPEIYGATVGVIKDSAEKKVDFSERYQKGRTDLNEFFAGAPPFLRRS